MKTLGCVVFIILLWTSCTPYTQFVQVHPRTDVPPGSKEIIVYAPLPELLAVLKEEGIMYNYKEGGVETEEIMIDEGTRARFSIYEYTDALKLVPYWGITDKVRQNIALWAGYGAASTYSNELTRVVYNKSETRPKTVFDYAAQIALKAGDVEFK